MSGDARLGCMFVGSYFVLVLLFLLLTLVMMIFTLWLGEQGSSIQDSVLPRGRNQAFSPRFNINNLKRQAA